MATVNITPVAYTDALYCHYPNESAPQPVELSLDIRDGELSCNYNPHIGGGTTFNHYHRLILDCPMPCLTSTAANTLMERIAPLAQRVLDGAEETWDGNNHVGVFTDDASAAWDEIAKECDPAGFEGAESNMVTGWSLEDWFVDGDESTIEQLGITADTTDECLTEIANEQSAQAATSGEYGFAVLDSDDVRAHLEALREELRIAVEDELEEVTAQYEEAKTARDAAIVRIHGWGAGSPKSKRSLRRIGELAQMSAPGVQRVISRAPAAWERVAQTGAEATARLKEMPPAVSARAVEIFAGQLHEDCVWDPTTGDVTGPPNVNVLDRVDWSKFDVNDPGWSISSILDASVVQALTEGDELPAGMYASTIPGQRGRLYEFGIDAAIGPVSRALSRAGFGGIGLNQGRLTSIQTWDRAQAMGAYVAALAAGYSVE